ncbi:hypothetical protein TNIN_133851 [Trichonephila inaurata madagascariensis]|uniref:Uncharacterized protein n=1 Tax=Trichonephila inaurata madagascariensis TaxID=2747483 RepID=A0A8X7BTB6_9ARAC|nr:hypothetical protein TNIN_133851 [Trichonephila inaurata madagascariensis]
MIHWIVPWLRHDDSQDSGRSHRRDLLRLLWVLGCHPLLQPVPGEDHHLPSLRAEDASREGTQEERFF